MLAIHGFFGTGTSGAKGRSGQLAHCLIVDDDPNVALLISTILAQDGYRTTLAANAAEAERLAVSEHPDLAFVDRNLPDQCGIDLVAKLRSHHPHLAVVMITGVVGPDVLAESRNVGATELLTKPFESIDLVSAAAARALRGWR